MKKALKIIGIVAACVVGVFGIVVGIAFAVGDKKSNIAPTSIYFSSTSVSTTEAFELTIDTTTENASQIDINLTVDREGIISFPKTVKLGEKIIVWPVKAADGNNVGGQVRLKADSGILHADCNILIDVPVSRITTDFSIKNKPNVESNNGIYGVVQGDYINFTPQYTPARGNNPTKRDTDTNNTNYKETIFVLIPSAYYGIDGAINTLDNLLSTDVARFIYNGRALTSNVFSTKDYPDLSKMQIGVVGADSGVAFYLKSYTFSTYEVESALADSNTLTKIRSMIGYGSQYREDVVAFSIGEVVPTTLNITNPNITLPLEKETKVYINNSSATDGINLGLYITGDNTGSAIFNNLLNGVYVEPQSSYVESGSVWSISDTITIRGASIESNKGMIPFNKNDISNSFFYITVNARFRDVDAENLILNLKCGTDITATLETNVSIDGSVTYRDIVFSYKNNKDSISFTSTTTVVPTANVGLINLDNIFYETTLSDEESGVKQQFNFEYNEESTYSKQTYLLSKSYNYYKEDINKSDETEQWWDVYNGETKTNLGIFASLKAISFDGEKYYMIVDGKIAFKGYLDDRFPILVKVVASASDGYLYKKPVAIENVEYEQYYIYDSGFEIKFNITDEFVLSRSELVLEGVKKAFDYNNDTYIIDDAINGAYGINSRIVYNINGNKIHIRGNDIKIDDIDFYYIMFDNTAYTVSLGKGSNSTKALNENYNKLSFYLEKESGDIELNKIAATSTEKISATISSNNLTIQTKVTDGEYATPTYDPKSPVSLKADYYDETAIALESLVFDKKLYIYDSAVSLSNVGYYEIASDYNDKVNRVEGPDYLKITIDSTDFILSELDSTRYVLDSSSYHYIVEVNTDGGSESYTVYNRVENIEKIEMYIDGGEVAYKYYVQGDSNSHDIDMNNFFCYFTNINGSVSILNPKLTTMDPIRVYASGCKVNIDMLAAEDLTFDVTDGSNGKRTFTNGGNELEINFYNDTITEATLNNEVLDLSNVEYDKVGEKIYVYSYICLSTTEDLNSQYNFLDDTETDREKAYDYTEKQLNKSIKFLVVPISADDCVDSDKVTVYVTDSPTYNVDDSLIGYAGNIIDMSEYVNIDNCLVFGCNDQGVKVDGYKLILTEDVSEESTYIVDVYMGNNNNARRHVCVIKFSLKPLYSITSEVVFSDGDLISSFEITDAKRGQTTKISDIKTFTYDPDNDSATENSLTFEIYIDEYKYEQIRLQGEENSLPVEAGEFVLNEYTGIYELKTGYFHYNDINIDIYPYADSINKNYTNAKCVYVDGNLRGRYDIQSANPYFFIGGDVYDVIDGDLYKGGSKLGTDENNYYIDGDYVIDINENTNVAIIYRKGNLNEVYFSLDLRVLSVQAVDKVDGTESEYIKIDNYVVHVLPGATSNDVVRFTIGSYVRDCAVTTPVVVFGVKTKNDVPTTDVVADTADEYYIDLGMNAYTDYISTASVVFKDGTTPYTDLIGSYKNGKIVLTSTKDVVDEIDITATVTVTYTTGGTYVRDAAFTLQPNVTIVWNEDIDVETGEEYDLLDNAITSVIQAKDINGDRLDHSLFEFKLDNLTAPTQHDVDDNETTDTYKLTRDGVDIATMVLSYIDDGKDTQSIESATITFAQPKKTEEFDLVITYNGLTYTIHFTLNVDIHIDINTIETDVAYNLLGQDDSEADYIISAKDHNGNNIGRTDMTYAIGGDIAEFELAIVGDEFTFMNQTYNIVRPDYEVGIVLDSFEYGGNIYNIVRTNYEVGIVLDSFEYGGNTYTIDGSALKKGGESLTSVGVDTWVDGLYKISISGTTATIAEVTGVEKDSSPLNFDTDVWVDGLYKISISGTIATVTDISIRKNGEYLNVVSLGIWRDGVYTIAISGTIATVTDTQITSTKYLNEKVTTNSTTTTYLYTYKQKYTATGVDYVEEVATFSYTISNSDNSITSATIEFNQTHCTTSVPLVIEYNGYAYEFDIEIKVDIHLTDCEYEYNQIMDVIGGSDPILVAKDHTGDNLVGDIDFKIAGVSAVQTTIGENTIYTYTAKQMISDIADEEVLTLIVTRNTTTGAMVSVQINTPTNPISKTAHVTIIATYMGVEYELPITVVAGE